MRIPRIYHPETLAINQTIILSKTAANHLSRVLRMRPGDSVILFDGSGTDYTGTLSELSKKQVLVALNHSKKNQTESPLLTHLGQAICRGDKMDWIIQKSVELGVNQITPLITQRNSVKWNSQQKEKKQQHWQNIIISSCEQCGRSTLPTLHPITHLADWLSQANQGTRLILHPTANHQPELTDNTCPITFLCGPESGFDPQEIDLATQSEFSAIQIGPRVLRAETAAIAMLSGLQWQLGDLGTVK